MRPGRLSRMAAAVWTLVRVGGGGGVGRERGGGVVRGGCSGGAGMEAVGVGGGAGSLTSSSAWRRGILGAALVKRHGANGPCGGGVLDAGAARRCGLGDVGGVLASNGASGLTVEKAAPERPEHYRQRRPWWPCGARRRRSRPGEGRYALDGANRMKGALGRRRGRTLQEGADAGSGRLGEAGPARDRKRNPARLPALSDNLVPRGRRSSKAGSCKAGGRMTRGERAYREANRKAKCASREAIKAYRAT